MLNCELFRKEFHFAHIKSIFGILDCWKLKRNGNILITLTVKFFVVVVEERNNPDSLLLGNHFSLNFRVYQVQLYSIVCRGQLRDFICSSCRPWTKLKEQKIGEVGLEVLLMAALEKTLIYIKPCLAAPKLLVYQYNCFNYHHEGPRSKPFQEPQGNCHKKSNKYSQPDIKVGPLMIINIRKAHFKKLTLSSPGWGIIYCRDARVWASHLFIFWTVLIEFPAVHQTCSLQRTTPLDFELLFNTSLNIFIPRVLIFGNRIYTCIKYPWVILIQEWSCGWPKQCNIYISFKAIVASAGL